MIYTKKEAMLQLPRITENNIRAGIDLALWLYLEKDWSFKRALDKACEKHDISPKKRLEELMRIAIPQEVIDYKSSAKAFKGSMRIAQGHYNKIKQLDKQNKRHLNSI